MRLEGDAGARVRPYVTSLCGLLERAPAGPPRIDAFLASKLLASFGAVSPHTPHAARWAVDRNVLGRLRERGGRSRSCFHFGVARVPSNPLSRASPAKLPDPLHQPLGVPEE